MQQDNVFSKQRRQTLDMLFANMKKQRMRSMTQKVNRGGDIQISQRRNAPRLQQGGGGARGGLRRQFNFCQMRGAFRMLWLHIPS